MLESRTAMLIISQFSPEDCSELESLRRAWFSHLGTVLAGVSSRKGTAG
jgi:hypothetical protein